MDLGFPFPQHLLLLCIYYIFAIIDQGQVICPIVIQSNHGLRGDV